MGRSDGSLSDTLEILDGDVLKDDNSDVQWRLPCKTSVKFLCDIFGQIYEEEKDKPMFYVPKSKIWPGQLRSYETVPIRAKGFGS